MATITIDGKKYDTDNLSKQTKAQLVNLNFVDSELRRLKAQAAVFETARQLYANALRHELGEATDHPKVEPAANVEEAPE